MGELGSWLKAILVAFIIYKVVQTNKTENNGSVHDIKVLRPSVLRALRYTRNPIRPRRFYDRHSALYGNYKPPPRPKSILRASPGPNNDPEQSPMDVPMDAIYKTEPFTMPTNFSYPFDMQGDKLRDPFKDPNFAQMNKKYRMPPAEDYYLPYVAKGQWVFSRKPELYTQQYTGAVTKKAPNPMSTPEHHMSRIPDTAHRFCPMVLKLYGRVCARRVNKTLMHYQYMTFDNICAMEDENNLRPTHRYDWHPVHTGICTDINGSDWREQVTSLDELLSRKSSWVFAAPTYVPTIKTKRRHRKRKPKS